ncbi:hypothetical protein EHS25_000795 [Saitozyma podzolica]|uniref:Peptidase M24 domain-containing protein n=1 Tax=Saitozyma podzolica TaxID=1890683 RepID=A0A427YX93_9TREE|nr:hypothetical protein EHS25_000795 [Saitozyma podzolica]
MITSMTTLAHGDPYATECYSKAAILASLAAHTVANSVKAGARLADLCLLGDRLIAEQCLEAVNQGICHPTTCQRNSTVANHAPFNSDQLVIPGDIVKIEVGAHINGYGAVVGINAPSSADLGFEDASGLVDEAKVVASRVLQAIKPGAKAWDITRDINEYLAETPYTGVIGMAGHNHSQWDIQGPKTINLFPTKEQLADPANDVIFEEGEVYTIEVWLTDAANGQPSTESNLETTLYLYQGGIMEINVDVLSKQARALAAQCQAQFRSLPFHRRELPSTVSEEGLDVLAKQGALAIYSPIDPRLMAWL